MLAQNTEKGIKESSKLLPEQQRCCFVLDITYFPAHVILWHIMLWYHSPLDSEGAAVVWDAVDVSPVDASETFCPAHMVFRV